MRRRRREVDVMDLFAMKDFDDHELVVFGRDLDTGLRAIIAVHSTVLGPAAGGCRMWPYASTNEAVTDVLRLSRGMSYKNAMAGLPFGGGKAVIIGDSRTGKTPELFGAYGRFVDSLGGRYVTAEDVGTTISDMESVARSTRYVSGLARNAAGAGGSGGTGAEDGPGAAGGDPAPKTALGVFLGIKAAARFKLGRTGLEDLSVAIQGVGGVGYHLCRLLAAEGARLIVSDVRLPAAERARDEFNAAVAPAEAILTQGVDVFAPCALGAVLHAQSIPQLRASIVAGAANNQLATDADGVSLHSQGVLYAPDYVINAGGIISVAREYTGGRSEAQVTAEIGGIPDRLTEIFERSRREKRPTNVIADDLARQRIRGAGYRGAERPAARAVGAAADGGPSSPSNSPRSGSFSRAGPLPA
jgi:leucine dehydrogenase